MSASHGQSLAERVEWIRKGFRAGEKLPAWTPEQWITGIAAKLGQAAIALATDQGPMTRAEREALDKEGLEHLLAVAAVAMDAAEQVLGLDESDLVTIVLGAPHNDKVLAEIRQVAEVMGIANSEALALLVGFGVIAAKEQGLIGDRASTPMSRGELLREIMTMLEHEE